MSAQPGDLTTHMIHNGANLARYLINNIEEIVLNTPTKDIITDVLGICWEWLDYWLNGDKEENDKK